MTPADRRRPLEQDTPWPRVLAGAVVCLLVAGVSLAPVVAESPTNHDLVGTGLAAIRRATASAVMSVTGPAARTSSFTPTSGSSSTKLAIPITTSTVHWEASSVPFAYDDIPRSYLVARPAGRVSGRLPVVVELSGSAVTAAEEAERAAFVQVATPAILVYPQDYEDYWDAGACCGAAVSARINDVGFISAVIAQVKAEQANAAKGRVYLAGYSNGGKMALRMACEAPWLFAAVAVYGATASIDCARPPPVSVLEMAGTADPSLAIGPGGPRVVQNGFTEPTVTAELDSYLRADGCHASNKTGTSGTMMETVWARCAHGQEDGLALYPGEDHSWPEQTSTSPSAQQVMWDFFVSLGA